MFLDQNPDCLKKARGIWADLILHGAVLMLLSWKQENTPGVPAAIQRTSLFVTDRTGEADFHHLSLNLRKKNVCYSAAASIQKKHRFATAAMTI